MTDACPNTVDFLTYRYVLLYSDSYYCNVFQRASARRHQSPLGSLSGHKESSFPKSENITFPKPAILISQKSAIPVQLTERPTPKPVSVTRPASKISTGRRSVKSHASHPRTPRYSNYIHLIYIEMADNVELEMRYDLAKTNLAGYRDQ